VHVSGHAAQGELTLLLSTLRPGNFVPVHGEYRHLAQHARLAASTGVPRERILICEDGDVVELADGKASRAGQVRAGMVMVDGLGIGDVGDAVLRDRRKLGGEGFVHVVVTIESQTGKVLAGPDIVTRGFVYEPESGDLIEGGQGPGARRPQAHRRRRRQRPMIVKPAHALGRLGPIQGRTQRRPVIIPTVMEV
jgi:ribonuclease J